MTPIQGALRHPSVPIQTALCQRDFDTAPHFLIGSEQSKHLRKEWLHVVIDNKIDTWMFLGMRSTLLSLYACLYLLGSHGVTPHHALYLQLFRSRHFPYIINKSVKTALIKQSSLKPYTLNACRLCPPAKISTHGAMHYRVEQLKQNCIGKTTAPRRFRSIFPSASMASPHICVAIACLISSSPSIITLARESQS